MKSNKIILKLLQNVKSCFSKMVNSEILKKTNNIKSVTIDFEDLKYFWFVLRKLKRDKIILQNLEFHQMEIKLRLYKSKNINK